MRKTQIVMVMIEQHLSSFVAVPKTKAWSVHLIYAWRCLLLSLLLGHSSLKCVTAKKACRENFFGLDLPRNLLPACSEWRLSDLCSDFSVWERIFVSLDSDGDGYIPLLTVGTVFQTYLESVNCTTMNADEEIRRFLQVVESDAHVKIGECGSCLMGWNDFKSLMWGYTTRALWSKGEESLLKSMRTKMIKEIVGNEAKIMTFVSKMLSLPREKWLPYLNSLSVESRRKVAGAALLSMKADDRAAMIQDLPEAERRMTLAKLEYRLDLRKSVQLLNTERPDDAGFVRSRRRLLTTAINNINYCTACASGTYNADCNDTYAGNCSECLQCGVGQYRQGCGGNSSGTCVICAAGSIKNYVGTWNSQCLTCPFGSYTNDSLIECYYVFSCKMWKEAGFNDTRTYWLSRTTQTTYDWNQSVPFQSDGITPAGGTSRQAHCDMATDGGGWMLMLNYMRAGDNVEGLVENSLPLSETRGFSHQFLNQFSPGAAALASEVRLLCTTSEHNRLVHFKTSHQGVLGIARRGVTASNNLDWWASNETTTLMPDHTGYLPQATNATNEDSAATRSLYDGFHRFPFYRYGAYHWTIRSSGRWECDNSERYQDDTLHQVWVR